jgi:hypothetical protein
MMLLLISSSPFTMEIPPIYRNEKYNHHEKMRDMVEDMDP